MNKHEHLTLYEEFLRSGSMPSSHSSITVALLTVVGVKLGVGSPEFGIIFVLTAIVIYDALNVRRSVGEQGAVLKLLAPEKTFFSAIGHRPIEVIAGAGLGLIVAMVMLQIL
jgi:acid phosphatase family membrane protein YuiD